MFCKIPWALLLVIPICERPTFLGRMWWQRHSPTMRCGHSMCSQEIQDIHEIKARKRRHSEPQDKTVLSLGQRVVPSGNTSHHFSILGAWTRIYMLHNYHHDINHSVIQAKGPTRPTQLLPVIQYMFTSRIVQLSSQTHQWLDLNQPLHWGWLWLCRCVKRESCAWGNLKTLKA